MVVLCCLLVVLTEPFGTRPKHLPTLQLGRVGNHWVGDLRPLLWVFCLLKGFCTCLLLDRIAH